MTDIIIGAILIAAVILASYKIYKNHKNGGCCGNCSGCSGCAKQDDTHYKSRKK
ncbi:FeoB-associated Cys-rich membrane protein [Diplocloster modestus]|uniref:FeoB-associated Cys-rich membrane protein n=1 Tax=Diplocloster modestus TaxID=2850322 RepID=A0ABS6KE80_9FIRM|nr:FeoB-associated Cys-rich membrane protein [Diplocloster modestus]MBU9728809.1 FeoB-associated Cys-rich membrane protein [Diplocloster modestus]